MQARYKLSTGLWTVKETPFFENDKEAWNTLRLLLPNKYAALYKEVEVEVPHNNEENYVECWNSKYGPPPKGQGSPSTEPKQIGVKTKSKVWIPVLEGVTQDEYKVT